jgi:hypothetical protein
MVALFGQDLEPELFSLTSLVSSFILCRFFVPFVLLVWPVLCFLGSGL